MHRTEYSSLRQGLVGAWCPSLGGSGLTLLDRSGRNNHATNTATVWQASSAGVALQYNGTSAVSQNNDVHRVMNGATSATLCGWMWRSATTQTAGFGFANSSSVATGAATKRFSCIWFSDGNVYGSTENANGTVYASSSLASVGWQHVVFRFFGAGVANSDRLQVFLNGVSASATYFGTLSSMLSTDLGPFCLGRDSSDRFCAGQLDDIRIYSRALTPAEIRLLASRRGIGLLPLPGRGVSLPRKLSVNVGGDWRAADAYVNVAGVWRLGQPSVNVGGTWK